MDVDNTETAKRAYHFLKSYKSLKNLFIVSQKQKHTLKELYSLLDIDKTEYNRLKSEILLDFARSYREGALLIYKDKN